jgi:dolichol kinase
LESCTVLGIGDSFAAIVGSKWGKLKVPYTKKTIEGFISLIISSSITLILIERLFTGHSCEGLSNKKLKDYLF